MNLTIKYKAELACQKLKGEIENYNRTVDQADSDFKPLLREVQMYDCKKTNILKYTLEKFNTYLEQMGHEIAIKTEDFAHAIGMINAETDIKIFVDDNRKHTPFFEKEEFKPYEPVEKSGKLKNSPSAMSETSAGSSTLSAADLGTGAPPD